MIHRRFLFVLATEEKKVEFRFLLKWNDDDSYDDNDNEIDGMTTMVMMTKQDFQFLKALMNILYSHFYL